MARNRLISTGLEPVLSRTVKSCEHRITKKINNKIKTIMGLRHLSPNKTG